MSQTTQSYGYSSDVLYHVKQGIAKITLNRPERCNTLTSTVISEISTKLEILASDPTVKVLVVASTGKAFSTGHDLKEMNRVGDEGFYRQLLSDCSKMMQAIIALPQPVIAQVQGIATAAGCQLVATCDLAIAANSARFATNGIHNGLYCATPQVALSRVVPRKHALEMLLTGDFIDAQRAAEIGLVNRVVRDEELESATGHLVSRITDKSQMAVRLGKTSYYRQAELPLDAAYRSGSEDLVRNLMAEDGVEGLTAFVEKRTPEWKDR